jgi:hypothetical protein
MLGTRIITSLGIVLACVAFARMPKVMDSEVFVDAERGASIVSFSKHDLQQGALHFGYYLNDSNIKTSKTLREIFSQAVEGDTISMGIPSNRVEYVFTFYDGDNQLHWLYKDSMSLADDVKVLFGEIEYARYQNITSSFTLVGASIFPSNKNGKKIFINGRLHTQGFLENPEVARLSSLRKIMPVPPVPPDSRDPRRFYIYLKDGTKAIAAKYPDAGNKFFSSGITWRQLRIDDEFIDKFGIVNDGAFPQNLCLPKSDVDKLSKEFFTDDSVPFWEGFKQHICGGFSNTKHPWIYTIIIVGFFSMLTFVWKFIMLPWIKGVFRKYGKQCCKKRTSTADAKKRLIHRPRRKRGI